MKHIKSVAAIHDISGIGKCSLTVIIPTLSAMGVQVCPVPTAVLSAHTGFGEFVMRDLTDFVSDALEHYHKLGTDFDCVYSGFLASQQQIDHCLDFLSAYQDALKVVDPVMGDNGKPYKTYTNEMCAKMVQLVRAADIITPNLTEAAILLGEDYPYGKLSVSEVKSWLVRLSQLGPKTVVITSVNISDNGISSVGYDALSNSFWRVVNDYVPASYSGCGDLYTAVLTGGLLSGDSLPVAMSRASGFTKLTVKTTYSYGLTKYDGILFEPQLPWLNGYNDFSDFESF
ncbi:MAG: pyridoxamine kinase [Ruminococcus sp.]|nr:pyridoxamine kinase [Ruminococcus sp.]